MQGLYQLSYVGSSKQAFRILPELHSELTRKTGAGNEVRTRDPQLGRLMLYQLSYSRPTFPNPINSVQSIHSNQSVQSANHIKLWWGGEDSNLRRRSRQIYSLIPLTTRVPPHKIDLLWFRQGGNANADRVRAGIFFRSVQLELARGLEPPTTSLQVRSSTS